MDTFEQFLRNNKLRVTTPRRLVFDALRQAKTPLSLRQIADSCSSVDRASIYRTIDTFRSIGVVHEVYFGWKTFFELAELFSPHHHHLLCTSCKKIYKYDDSELETKIEAIASEIDFVITLHRIDIEGTCRQCCETSRRTSAAT